jgi:hypothetical protein
MSSSDYHGVKPVTDDDKKMAKVHLKASEKILDAKKDLLEDKIDDHKKALKERMKSGDDRSASYNRSHLVNHEHDMDEVDADHDKIQKSLATLASLRTHKRAVYNDVRKAKVGLIYRKSGVKNGSTQ